ncbi:MAG TPA: 50S ribosomal protein L25 [Geobacteraceae bacterium]|nr:50S ribosomal protein L25 [Geobacteraceae bacterium]
MEQRVLTIETREKLGKGICRRLRENGRIPAVVYGKGIESVAVSVDKKELEAAIAGEGGRNNLLTLKGATALDGKIVIVADMACSPLKGSMLHVDLHNISLQEKVKVKVPISITEIAKGVKEGGIQDIVRHEIEVECLPTEIPEHIEVDVTELGLGESLHVSDLQLPLGLKVLDDPSATVVNIVGKVKQEGEAVEEEVEETE